VYGFLHLALHVRLVVFSCILPFFSFFIIFSRTPTSKTNPSTSGFFFCFRDCFRQYQFSLSVFFFFPSASAVAAGALQIPILFPFGGLFYAGMPWIGEIT